MRHTLELNKTANSADPDEMLPYAAFHLGLQCCLPLSRIKLVKPSTSNVAFLTFPSRSCAVNLILDRTFANYKKKTSTNEV